MEESETDWKYQDRHVFDWVAVLLATALVVVYLYQWWDNGRELYASLAVILIVWGAVYFTDYWQPILYLLIALVISTVTFIWIWDGAWKQPIVQVAIVLNFVFVVLSIYLFSYEDFPLYPFQARR